MTIASGEMGKEKGEEEKGEEERASAVAADDDAH